MASHASRSPSPTFHLSVLALALLAAAGPLLLLARLSGYSVPRLLLVGFTLLLALAAAATAARFHVRPKMAAALQLFLSSSRRAGPLRYVLASAFLILWCIMWLPPQYTGPAYYYFIGFFPLILCAWLATGLGLVFVLVTSNREIVRQLGSYWKERRATLVAALISLVAFLGIALFTRFGSVLNNSEPYWRGAGVPLLAVQVFIAVIFGLAALQLEGRLPATAVRLDLIVFLVTWVIAAALWARQPVEASFWVTAPRAPNFEYYPFSDLETFDLGSQFALIGQGINNGVFWDRALYMSFLVYLHAVGGQNYEQLMAIQAALFAVFPALLYLLGARLYSRNAGIILAALIVMRGLNSLPASPLVHSSTFKHMLTDFPTAIGLAVAVLLLLRWGRSKDQRRSSLLWVGGTLGLTSLLRTHVLLVLALVVVPAVLMRRAERRRLLLAGLVLSAFLAAVLPWMLLGAGATSVFTFYGRRMFDVVQQRYPRSPLMSSALIPAAWKITAAYPVESAGPEDLSSPQPGTLPLGARPLPPPDSAQLPFPVLHFAHNLVTSALILPASPQFLSLRDTLRFGETFWGLRWNGAMSPVAAGMLVVNLTITAIGLGAAWQRHRWWGLLPVAVFIAYHAANALARTSGGRYLVPVDWILVTYFALGIADLLVPAAGLFRGNLVAHAEPVLHETSAQLTWGWPRTGAYLASIFLIGCLVPLAGVLYPLRYPALPKSSVLEEALPSLAPAGLERAQLESFLGKPGAVLLRGRALYPRYFRQDAGIDFSRRPFHARNYPRMVFDLIGRHGMVYVILPGGAPEVFPNTADAYVLGCRASEAGLPIVQAHAVVLPGESVLLSRDPEADLACPVIEPVCDDNGNCN